MVFCEVLPMKPFSSSTRTFSFQAWVPLASFFFQPRCLALLYVVVINAHLWEAWQIKCQFSNIVLDPTT